MRTAGLDHAVELPGLLLQGLPKFLQGRQEVMLDGDQGSEVDGRGDDVVRGLAHVDVVVRMDRGLGAEFAAEYLDRPVGDDLVGVHVGGGTRPCLEHVEDEGMVQPPLDDLLRRLHDGVLRLVV